tara:strand:- start:1266 stop:1826 length:561 start_codon:yes stop_codon:yes gene_type:complete
MKIKIGAAPPKPIKINIGEEKQDESVKVSLNAKRTLDGNLIIFDHADIDIVIMKENNKVVAFAKDTFGDHVYEAQDRLFKFLARKGIVTFDSVQGGNVYSSMEGKIAESTDYNEVQNTLFVINKFIEKERPYFEFEKAFDRAEEERLLEPGPEESTEFDPEKYHADEKGSIKPGQKAYGLANIYRL